MRTNWKTAPQHVRDNLAGWRTLDNAQGWVGRVFAAGYDLEQSEVPQSSTLALRASLESEQGIFRTEHASELASEAQAMKLWQSRRAWAQGSKEDDAAKFTQQREAANTERARITNERFTKGLVGAVQGLIADQWHRANVAWQQEHAHRIDPTDEPAQPSFSDTVDAVLARLGYVRATEQPARTRKAS